MSIAASAAGAAPDRVGPVDAGSIQQILKLLPQLPIWSALSDRCRQQMPDGAGNILRWLAGFDGNGWQQRWRASGADAGPGWLGTIPPPRPMGDSPHRRGQVNRDGMSGLLLCRVVLPDYDFLAAFAVRTDLFERVRKAITPQDFTRMAAHAAATGMPDRRAHEGLNAISRLVLHTGLNPTRLSLAEFEEFRDWGTRRRGHPPSEVIPAWDLLRGIGAVQDLPYRAIRRVGQRPTAELIDRYQLRCKPVRDVLIRYLDERRPALDYTSLLNVVSVLAGRFWADIEAHHRDIESLRLPEEVATAWKERLRLVTTRRGEQRPRQNYLHILTQVRSFYLDIQEWAWHDPSWAPHAVPSPVRQAETAGFAKHKRRVTAAMHQRIRERLPKLAILIETAERRHTQYQDLLTAALAVQVGEEFQHDQIRYRRICHKSHNKAASSGPVRRRPRHRPAPAGVVLAQNTATDDILDLTKTEDETFWAWAIIETLRHTGVRIEELLELTHLALVSYRLPDTGELVPLLQILPSKNDQERLLLVGPDLASVLATIISRLRDTNSGSVPLTRLYDRHERVFGPPLPLLFQRTTGHRNEAISVGAVQLLLDRTLKHAGLTDAAGQPLRFTPHDFRRIFATDAVTGGLPVHITARLLGHQNIATTQAYLAVFQDDLIRTYRTFLDQRRSLRPQAEYREPSTDEWREFQQHFALRKLELGTCARPYGTPCKHEHACIRCPMLHIDPTGRRRLTEIIANLTERITEARLNGWHGEVQGLQVSLHAAADKLAALDRLQNHASTPITDLGIPEIRNPNTDGTTK